MAKTEALTCRSCSVSLLSPRTPTDPHRDICFWCERKELRALVRGLAKAIEGLMEGIDDYWRTTPEGTGAVFHARSILESVPSDLKGPPHA